MDRFLFYSLLGLFLISSLVSCKREDSDTVDQDKIWTKYELYYNSNEDKTYARAWFKFSHSGGTQLELVDQSEVTFNGDVLSFRDALAYYEKEYSGLTNSGTFKWKDADGNTFENSIDVHSIGYPASLDTIPRDSSYEFHWTGDSLGSDESVTVTINGENESDARIFTQDDVNSTSVIMSKSKLQDIGQGEGEVFMDRRFKPDLTEQTSAGGKITGRYRPDNQKVYMK